MIFRKRSNKRGEKQELRTATCRISSAALIAAAMLLAGCGTVERIKEAVTPEPAPAKKAGATSESPAKKAPATTESLPAKKSSATAEPAQGSASRPSAQTALTEGVDFYDKGEFNRAIRRLNAPEIWSADKSVQVKALKYMAFSYCVTSRKTLCSQQFEKALKLDPAFDLEPGEKGHPLWGTVFERAKKGK
jgi:hypothetical protein